MLDARGEWDQAFLVIILLSVVSLHRARSIESYAYEQQQLEERAAKGSDAKFAVRVNPLMS